MSLQRNQKQYELTGNSRKRYIANIQAEIKQTEALRSIVGITAERYAFLTVVLAKLNELVEKPTAFQKFNNAVQQIGQQMNTMISSFSDLVKQQQTKTYEFIDNVAKREGKSAEWVAHQKEMVDKQYFKKLKAMSIAQAVINGALAITNIWATTADITGVGLKIAFSLLSAANTAAQIAVISGQGMAQGGIVPSGYNNDTYPALLSSGEVVVPPHKLPNMLGAGKQTIVLEGELVARGKDLVYIFQQQGKLMHSY
jgi:hypothetical protein